MHLTENLGLFPDYADRITVVVYEGPQTAVGWDREEIARAAVRSAVIDLDPDTVVYFSDLDELPSNSQLEAMRSIDQPHGVPLDAYFRRANWRLECESPNMYAKASPVGSLPDDFTKFRWPQVEDSQNFYPHLGGERGCHFSYLGFETSRIADKVAAFSHSEYLFAMDEADHLMTVCDALALDQYGRARQPGAGLLTVLQQSEWSDLHRWVHAQHPEWFDTHDPGNLTWRLMNAAVIDDAMRTNDLTKIRVIGGWRVLLGAGGLAVHREHAPAGRGDVWRTGSDGSQRDSPRRPRLTRMSRGSTHLRSLTSLRFFAAGIVVMYHAAMQSAPDYVNPFALLRFGFVGVTFFFVLSGFVLVWSARDGDSVGGFYRRRFARVWPVHALTLAAAIALAGWGLITHPGGLGSAALNLTLLQAWSPDPAVITDYNGLSWSLSDEAFFYALFPLLLVLARKLRPEIVVAVGACWLLFGAIALDLVGMRLDRLYSFPAHRVGEFVCGMGLALLLRRGIPAWIPRPAIAVAALGGSYVALVTANIVMRGEILPELYVPGLWLLPGICLVILAFARRDVDDHEGWLTRPTLVRLGQWSFALYMVHELLFGLCGR